MSQPQKWIDLNDRASGAKLKLDQVNGDRFLFIIGLSKNSPKWEQAISKLGFRASPNQKFLLRLVQPDERIKKTQFHEVFPAADYAVMPPEQIGLNLAKRSSGQTEQRSAEERDIANELANARRLGRNADGDEVYEGGSGRFIYRGEKGIVPEMREMRGMRPSMFLRGLDPQSLDECADGFVRSMLHNEVQRQDDVNRFIRAALPQAQGLESDEGISVNMLAEAHELVHAAVTRSLAKDFDTANDAYGNSVRLYEYMPRRRGGARGAATMPIPLAVIAQRLLGDTSGKTVVLPFVEDGASLAFLAKDARIRAYQGAAELPARVRGMQRDGVEWLQSYHAAREANPDAIFFNAHPVAGAEGTRQDYRDAMAAIRTLAPRGRAVLVVAGDDPIHPGVVGQQSRQFLESLYSRYDVEDVFETGRELCAGVGTDATLRVISLTNRPPVTGEDGRLKAAPVSIPVCHSWDEVKARVDESLARAAVSEAESDGIDLDKTGEDNSLQRPYLAFSRVGEATTMVPKELQAPLQAHMSEMEALHGPIDAYVEREMGYAGEETLASRFSPEQVDAIAMAINRHSRGRGNIIGDETGIGKGRTIAAIATWALKKGRNVVFMTDRANLFSDLARDLRDIGEWGRVRPFVMNSDGRIEDSIGDAGVLAEGIARGEMSRILADNTPLEATGCNMVFTTYSQISGEGSEKAVWLKNQLKDALLIVDEAHVGAGSDSNISTQIAEMTQMAWAAQYSSATWAKSAKNLHIFARAFPESVNVSTLAETMKRGGEAFAEVFSSMLAREGALIRREHDLSRLEFRVEVDTVNTDRNNQVADRVAEIMSALAFTAGSLKRVVTRMSDINVAALRDARDVRSTAQKTEIFKSRFGSGSMLYQVNRRMNAALNVDNAVRLAMQGLEEGRKPVIVFEDTGESFVKQAMEMQRITLPDGTEVLPEAIRPPTIRDLMRRIVETLAMVRVEEVSRAEAIEMAERLDQGRAAEDDAEGNVDEPPEGEAQAGRDAAMAGEPGADSGEQEGDQAGAPVVEEGVDVAQAAQALENVQGSRVATRGRGKRKAGRKFRLVPFFELESIPEADRRTFQDGLAEINRMIDSLPEIGLNVPDEISRRLSAANIRLGELSGRSFQLVPSADEEHVRKGLFRVVNRPRGKTHVNAVVRAFNSGALDVVMLNRSAATGLSLHASPRFSDRRRRQLIEMQIPENPADRLQLYGRVNRFDQESFPLICVASTGIYGEVRQIMVQNKKLAEMSANVRSSRDSHALIKEVPDLLNPVGREVCRQFLEDNPEILMRLDLSPADILPNSSRDTATALTSRVPFLRLEEQKQVYEQLYAMFEDAIVQAELSGNNPLKPNELDVRAKVGAPRLMFGFDHKGLGSAFDGGVFAQRLDWQEDVRPMSVEAIVEVIRINREKLVASGRVREIGRTSAGTVQIDISELAKRASLQLEGRARMAVAGTSYKSAEEALRDKNPNPVRRGMARAKWIAKNLPLLVPGRLVSIPRGKENASVWNRNAVILDVIPPADRRESQLAQWRIVTIGVGESKPVSMTLNALMGELVVSSGTPLNIEGGQVLQQVAPEMEAMSRLNIGADFMDLHEQPDEDARRQMPNAWIYSNFNARWAGIRDRKALVLTGNMYLASEWAAQTKAGQGVVFTDDRGMRHRGILLRESFKPEWLRYLPVRLWMPEMIQSFTAKLMDGSIPTNSTDGYFVYSGFDGAWKSTANTHGRTLKDAIVITPGGGVRMYVGKESRRRVLSMIRQAQKLIKEELYPGQKVTVAEDPGHVVIKDTGRGAARNEGDDVVNPEPGRRARKGENDWIVMQAETPEKMQRALQMLIRGPGLEVFVPPSEASRELVAAARSSMRDYFVERLRSDAAGDAGRLSQIEGLIGGDAVMDERAEELERAIDELRTDDGEMTNVEIDFQTGLPVDLEAASGAVDPNELFGAVTEEEEVRRERMSA